MGATLSERAIEALGSRSACMISLGKFVVRNSRFLQAEDSVMGLIVTTRTVRRLRADRLTSRSRMKLRRRKFLHLAEGSSTLSR
jgi:hypothetical protein